MRARVAVIGGGISGLAAAWLLRRGPEPVDVVLLEASSRLGGKILTERIGDFLIEGGPDSFLTLRPHAVEFAAELGLRDRLVIPLEPGGASVLHRGRLHPLPDGLGSLIPQRLGPFLRSTLFSPWEKARFGLDLFLPPSRNGPDESLGGFVRRRLGDAAVDRLAAPLLAGIHAGDVERLSLRATFPQFAEAERRYGSLTRAIFARRRARRPSQALPMFMTLRGGLEELVDGAAAALGDAVRTNAVVHGIAPRGRGYSVVIEDRGALAADAVILATPARSASQLLRNANAQAAGLLEAIPHVSTIAVALAFRREAVRHPLRGHGYVTSRAEGTLHTACTWMSSKWPGRSPDGHVLLRVYAGRAGDQRATEMDDRTLTEALLDELTPLLGISAPPVLRRVYRWKEAMPQYELGHLEHVGAIRRALQATPGIFLTGSTYEGVGIPDCIRQGKEAAGATMEFLHRDRR